ncbi:endonuclease/exonuclease/phosphatase family protein [Salegentibacter chungangensis]|uniref:Endonuclease/exonuclease/phosphatase family protein n=1 Tax=Salegentibacter chungangensis TaxID=1335724 RepID=A0ABW3NQ08_9FLAO
MKLKRFLQGFGIIAVLLTLVPLIAADYWWIRMFDYPHIQLTLLTLTAISAYFIRFDIKRYEDYAFMIVLLACFTFQFLKIAPYTPITPYEINKTKKQADIKILTANVLQKNKEKDSLINEVKKHKPDVIVFTETDAAWQNAISKGFKEYPYRSEAPLDNTYGMLVYSKLPLIDPEVKYIVDDSIPSVHAKIELKNGEKIQLFAIHPTPPMPQHNPSSTDRDAEMMKIAKLTRESELPVIVIGDFNDVAWSSTTSLFKNVGGLLDIRVGRGFYNTFNAKSFLMRWSLDHIFLTEEFRLKEIGTGGETGSDHFPYYASLSLEPEKAEEQKPDSPSPEQLKDANEQIKEEEKENKEKQQEKREEQQS